MGLEQRIDLIRKIEKERKSSVICYLTSVRPGVAGVIAEDAVRVIFDHLLALDQPIYKLDIFLCSNGGNGVVPWRLISLFREFAKTVGVLIPYRAYSAATLLALGADEIVMHPFGELGPIDPTVQNEFNPTDQSGRRLGISVEDVTAYVHFIRTTVGIRHEDELIEAIKILADKVHPLAIGNVERFLTQSRMIAGKLLRTHMPTADKHTIDEIVENMASKLYFHGHPINRQEARSDLKLKVVDKVSKKLEDLLWDLYLEYATEFKNDELFFPAGELADIRARAIEALQPGQPVQMSIPHARHELLHVMVECSKRSSKLSSEHYYELTQLPTGQRATSDDLISQAWSHSPVP